MALDLCDYEQRTRDAVQHFWRTRKAAADNQVASGKSDQGTRGSVTAGKHMDGFCKLFVDLAKANGLPSEAIVTRGPLLTLPGYFRPAKNWDLIVINEGRLVAAIEFKSQVGSIGNNANNRAEEVLGLGVDLATAYREGAFGQGVPQPFVGYMFLLEDSLVARRDGQDLNLRFPVFAEFHNASYAERYDLLCRKMVHEKIYTAASVILAASSASATGDYSEISPGSSLGGMVTAFAGHIASEAARPKGIVT